MSTLRDEAMAGYTERKDRNCERWDLDWLARERAWVVCWGDIVKASIRDGLAAQAGGDARIAFRRASVCLEATRVFQQLVQPAGVDPVEADREYLRSHGRARDWLREHWVRTFGSAGEMTEGDWVLLHAIGHLDCWVIRAHDRALTRGRS